MNGDFRFHRGGQGHSDGKTEPSSKLRGTEIAL